MKSFREILMLRWEEGYVHRLTNDVLRVLVARRASSREIKRVGEGLELLGKRLQDSHMIEAIAKAGKTRREDEAAELVRSMEDEETARKGKEVCDGKAGTSDSLNRSPHLQDHERPRER